MSISTRKKASTTLFELNGMMQHIDVVIGLFHSSSFFKGGTRLPTRLEEPTSLYTTCVIMKKK